MSKIEQRCSGVALQRRLNWYMHPFKKATRRRKKCLPPPEGAIHPFHPRKHLPSQFNLPPAHATSPSYHRSGYNCSRIHYPPLSPHLPTPLPPLPRSPHSVSESQITGPQYNRHACPCASNGQNTPGVLPSSRSFWHTAAESTQ